MTLGALALILLGASASLLCYRRRAQGPIGKGKKASIALMSSQEASKGSTWFAWAAPAAAPEAALAAAPAPAPLSQMPTSGFGAATWLNRTPVVRKLTMSAGGGDDAPTSAITTAVAAASAPQVSTPRRGRRDSVGSALFHFIDHSGEKQPAVPGSQLKEWLAQGVVTEDTFVWADDARTPDWAPLWQASALFAYCEKTTEGGTPGSKPLVNRLHTSEI